MFQLWKTQYGFAFRSHQCACLDGYNGDGCEFEILKEQKSPYHPVLRIIGYGVWAALVATIATVVYHRKFGEKEPLEGTKTKDQTGGSPIV